MIQKLLGLNILFIPKMSVCLKGKGSVFFLSHLSAEEKVIKVHIIQVKLN